MFYKKWQILGGVDNIPNLASGGQIEYIIYKGTGRWVEGVLPYGFIQILCNVAKLDGPKLREPGSPCAN